MNTTILLILMAFLVAAVMGAKDMMRKSIVFDKNTPDVFYCPIHKPTGFDKLIVKARPLKKLCEFEGKPVPEDYKSDCYQDVDESDYACKEKYRIMMRMHPPSTLEPYTVNEEKQMKRLARFINVDKEFYVMKLDEKKVVPTKPTRSRGKSYLRNRLVYSG